MKNYYDILGVQKNASQEEIKKAFHRLAHQHHPHKGGDEKKFKEVNEAYQILSDEQKRAQYDQYGQVFENGMPGGGAGFDPSWFWANRTGGGAGEGFEFDLGDIGDIFGDFFGFGGGGRRAKDVKKGSDIKIGIEIPLESVLIETKKIISLKKMISCARCSGNGAEPGTKINECPICRGKGQVQQVRKIAFGSFTQTTVCPECKGEGQRPEKPCNVCKGEGRIKGEEEIDIFIPAGIDNNQVIKISGKGNAGRRNAKSGDLYVTIAIQPHSIFERRGDDLYVKQDISFVKASLGGEIEIPTLDNKKILLDVPEATETGKIFKISGKGVPHFSGFGRGALFVQLNIKTPKKLTKKQKELLRELEKDGL